MGGEYNFTTMITVNKSVTVYLLKTCGNRTEVCLGMKRVGYGKGKWNGFGGKIEKGETPGQAAIRELNEESGIVTQMSNLQKMAEILYHEPTEDWYVHVFVCNKWVGNPAKSDEMIPRWFEVGNIPYNEMWENDALWLPKVLEGNSTKCVVWNNAGGKMLRYKIVS